MQLLSAWKQSLLLFEPKNFKLFVLVTFKTMWEGVKILLSWWWIFVLLHYALLKFFPYSIVSEVKNKSLLIRYLNHFIVIISILLFCLAVRPSIKKKNLYYLKDYLLPLIIIIIAYDLFYLIMSYMGKFAMLIGDIFFPAMLFFSFFLFDQKNIIKGTFYSFISAVKMVIYNLPLVLILSFIGALLRVLVKFLKSSLFTQIKIIMGNASVVDSWQFWAVVCFFILLNYFLRYFVVCIYNNIYIKNIHQHPELYIKQK